MMIRPETHVVASNRPSLRGVSARGRIDGLMLRMELEQTYVNAGSDPLEVVFTFPLPLAATLLGVEADIGGRRMLGTVLGRERAEDGYEAAIEDGDSAIMVERAREGLYTVNLGNLLPQDTLKLTLRYGQLLRYEQGIVRAALPTTLGQWYGDASKQGRLAPHQAPEVGGLDDYPFDLSIRVAGTLANAHAECVTHPVTLRHEGGDLVAALCGRAWLDRDFVLTFSGLASQSVLVRVPDYAAPEGSEAAEVVIASLCPRMGDAMQARVDLKVLIDCSGSMVGPSIDSARHALFGVLDELRPDDRFSVGRFGTRIEQLFEALQPAQGKALAQARADMHLLAADMGGTEMHAALMSTLALSGASGAPAVLLITDGAVWDIDRIVEAASAGRQRVFAIGVGSAPSESLLRELAERTGGACDIVPPGEDMSEAVMRMFRRIRQQGRVAVTVEWGAKPIWQAPLPEAVYAGDTVHLMAAFARGAPVQPVLCLSTAGESCRIQSPPAQYCDDTDLSRMAAQQIVDDLSHAGQQGWAVRYQLVTATTHMLLRIDRDIKAAKPPRLERIRHTDPARLIQTDFSPMPCEIPPVAKSIRFSKRADIASSSVADPSGPYNSPPMDRSPVERQQPEIFHEDSTTQSTDAVPHAALRALIENAALAPVSWGEFAVTLASRMDVPELKGLDRLFPSASRDWPLALLALCMVIVLVYPISRHARRMVKAAKAELDDASQARFESVLEEVHHLIG